MAPSNVSPLKLDSVARNDGWANAITGIGKQLYDKRLWSDFDAHELSHEETEELWAGDDVAARIVELVPDECLRQGFELQIEDDEGDQAEAVMALLDEVDAIGHLREALCYARAYGGGAILLGANDGGRADKPLNLASVKSLGWMLVLSPRELEVASRYADPSKPQYAEPEVYRIRMPSTEAQASSRLAYFANVHETRLIRFSGPRISRRRQLRAGGWGESVLTRCWQVIRDFQNAWQGSSLLLAEVGQLVYKIKGLAELLADGNDAAVIRRAQMADQSRSICRALITDGDDTLERMSVELSGLPPMLQQFALRLAAAARIPVTLLMGQAPAGLNATGESDVRWFYDTVKAEQKRVLLPGLNRLLEVIFNAKAGPTGGREPENWTVRFNPPWQMTEAEQVEMRQKQSLADVAYITAGVLTPEEVASSRFGGDAYSIDTKLDLEARARFEDELAAEEAEPQPEPGADDQMLEETSEVQTSQKVTTGTSTGTGTRTAAPRDTVRR